MKKLSIILICLVLLSTITLADELTGSVSEIQEKPSTTPGHFTWGIQRAIERIKLAMTFGAENKAAYGLQIAEKRLAEIQELAASNDTENTQKAVEAYKQQIEQIKEQIAKLKDANSEKELQKLAFFEEKLLRFEDKIQRLQSYTDTKLNLTEDQQEKLSEILDQIKEKDEELKEKLDERGNKTKERFNLTKEDMLKKIEEIKSKHNITQLKQELIQREIQRLQLKQQKLSELVTQAEAKGKDATVLKERLEAVSSNIQQIQSSNLSVDEQKELLKETQQLLNFRQVYRQNKTEDIKELKEKIQEKIKESHERTKTKIANPASVYCEQHDGELEIRETSSGQVGYCKFSDDSECEEWAYFRGECKPQGTTNQEENQTI